MPITRTFLTLMGIVYLYLARWCSLMPERTSRIVDQLITSWLSHLFTHVHLVFFRSVGFSLWRHSTNDTTTRCGNSSRSTS